jgi:hypothetical protein
MDKHRWQTGRVMTTPCAVNIRTHFVPVSIRLKDLRCLKAIDKRGRFGYA